MAGTAQIQYQKNVCIRVEMLPQNITYTLDSPSHQLFVGVFDINF